MKKILLVIFIFTLSCSNDWNYESPEKWDENNEKNKFCKIGYNQSPIDVKYEFEKSELSFDYKKSEVEKIPKLHHLSINFYGKNFVTRGKKKYLLREISFHHPSEHLIDGKAHSLEMQISHKSEDEQWLILAVFLEVGKENSDFANLIKFLASRDKEIEINPSNLVKNDDEIFFYDGSFTTPPCKEGVKWYVMKTPIKISKEQMNKIIKSTIFVKTNARPVQEFHPEKY